MVVARHLHLHLRKLALAACIMAVVEDVLANALEAPRVRAASSMAAATDAARNVVRPRMTWPRKLAAEESMANTTKGL